MRSTPTNYYDAFDELYRASWGLALHHGWFDRERGHCSVAVALSRFQNQIIRRLELDTGTPLTLCDVGCGYGLLAASLIDRGLIANAVGVTDSKAQVDHALRAWPGSPRLQIQHGNWLQNAFPEESFDRLTAIESLYHFPGTDKRRAIGELARVLRPTGRAVVTLWLKKDASSRSCRLIDRGMGAWGSGFGSLATAAEIRSWLSDHGLVVKRYEDVTAKVSPTIPLLVGRVLSMSWSEPSTFWSILAHPGVVARAGTALVTTWLGYATGALRYAIVEIEKP